MHAANDNPLQDAAAGTAGEPAAQNPQVRTLLLTDLCDSTMLVERLGDNAAAELFRAHDRLVLELQQRWHGRLIDRSDGLLLLFERAIDGLGFALDYARGLRELGERRDVAKHGVALLARQGLHVGEVLTWRNSDAAVSIGAKPLEVEGLAKPMAGRLMTLARPGQILLSATAEPLAHRAGILRIAQFVIDTAQALHKLQSSPPQIATLSIGACPVALDQRWEDWYANADAALYRAKRLGGNRVEWQDAVLAPV